jgi:hypothetical protein
MMSFQSGLVHHGSVIDGPRGDHTRKVYFMVKKRTLQVFGNDKSRGFVIHSVMTENLEP